MDLERDLSFLLDVQREVFKDLSAIYAHVSEDVLIDILISPDNFEHGMSKEDLFDRCLDALEAQNSSTIDLTGFNYGVSLLPRPVAAGPTKIDDGINKASSSPLLSKMFGPSSSSSTNSEQHQPGSKKGYLDSPGASSTLSQGLIVVISPPVKEHNVVEGNASPNSPVRETVRETVPSSEGTEIYTVDSIDDSQELIGGYSDSVISVGDMSDASPSPPEISLVPDEDENLSKVSVTSVSEGSDPSGPASSISDESVLKGSGLSGPTSVVFNKCVLESSDLSGPTSSFSDENAPKGSRLSGPTSMVSVKCRPKSFGLSGSTSVSASERVDHSVSNVKDQSEDTGFPKQKNLPRCNGLCGFTACDCKKRPVSQFGPAMSQKPGATGTADISRAATQETFGAPLGVDSPKSSVGKSSSQDKIVAPVASAGAHPGVNGVPSSKSSSQAPSTPRRGDAHMAGHLENLGKVEDANLAGSLKISTSVLDMPRSTGSHINRSGHMKGSTGTLPPGQLANERGSGKNHGINTPSTIHADSKQEKRTSSAGGDSRYHRYLKMSSEGQDQPEVGVQQPSVTISLSGQIERERLRHRLATLHQSLHRDGAENDFAVDMGLLEEIEKAQSDLDRLEEEAQLGVGNGPTDNIPKADGPEMRKGNLPGKKEVLKAPMSRPTPVSSTPNKAVDPHMRTPLERRIEIGRMQGYVTNREEGKGEHRLGKPQQPNKRRKAQRLVSGEGAQKLAPWGQKQGTSAAIGQPGARKPEYSQFKKVRPTPGGVGGHIHGTQNAERSNKTPGVVSNRVQPGLVKASPPPVNVLKAPMTGNHKAGLSSLPTGPHQLHPTLTGTGQPQVNAVRAPVDAGHVGWLDNQHPLARGPHQPHPGPAGAHMPQAINTFRPAPANFGHGGGWNNATVPSVIAAGQPSAILPQVNQVGSMVNQFISLVNQADRSRLTPAVAVGNSRVDVPQPPVMTASGVIPSLPAGLGNPPFASPSVSGVGGSLDVARGQGCDCNLMGIPCNHHHQAGPSQKPVQDPSAMMARVIGLFPDVCPDFVRKKLESAALTHPDPVQWLCNLMLEEQYPRKPSTSAAKPKPPSKPRDESIDYLNNWRDLPVGYGWSGDSYVGQGRQTLAAIYRMVSMTSIDEVMRVVKRRICPSLHILQKVVESKEYASAAKLPDPRNVLLMVNVELPGERKNLPDGQKKETRNFRIKLNKQLRGGGYRPKHDDIKREIRFYSDYQKDKQLETDHQLAINMNQEEYEKNQQGIECECCYVEHPFENMVQCFEMHLFCTTCLQSYVKESVFGQGKGDLTCMAGDCSSTFPREQLEKSLTPEMLAKYDERMKEESVQLADLEDLVRCPHCQFAASLAPEVKAFLCPQCSRETCRECQIDWTEHFGKKCSELENKREEELRTKYEEKLTEALIRQCHRCKAKIVKETGCNKMTCRCGAKMCYICRKPDIDYDHFCRHVRDPKVKGCQQCTACCLWEVAEVSDEKKMKEIKKDLNKEQDEKGIESSKRAVGVPDDVGPGPSKKPRKH